MRRGEARRTDPSRTLRRRLVVLALVVTLGFALMGWRLYAIQILQHERYRRSAEDMHSSAEKVYAYRGDILSRDGVLLARDVINYEVGLDPTWIDVSHLHRAVRDICRITGASVDSRRRKLALALEKKASGPSARGSRWLPLGRRIEEVTKREIEQALTEYLDAGELRGLVLRPYTRRTYPRGPFMSAVIGVTNGAGRGTEGLERVMDPVLSARDGHRQLQVGGKTRGQLRAHRLESAYVAPVSGYNLRTTIDSRVQSITERTLRWGIERADAEAGVCIVMDCNTGEILALANDPTYDPERFRDYPRPERERRRRNRAVENLHEPGSLMKPFIMAGALEHGVVRLDRSIRSCLPPGVTWSGGSSARFGSRVVRDVRPHPEMTVAMALTQSSNIGMAVVGILLGRDRIIDTLQRFGFTAPTGVPLPAEVSGHLPDADRWTRFYDTVSVSFGYAVMVSPIQLVRGFAALVNGGYLLEPRVVHSYERDGERGRLPGRTVVGQAISNATSGRIRELLAEVVQNGTARYLKVEGLPFGAKTGTAHMVDGKRYSRTDYLASFQAAYPIDDPQVVLLCMIEKPRGPSHYGAMVSGPVVVEILRQMFGVKEECQLARIQKWEAPVGQGVAAVE